MPRRKAWNGDPPATAADAHRRLLDAARDCVERLGMAKTSLSDVAEEAGVTRQTVYRHFESSEALFRSAAVLASGGIHERMRKRALTRERIAERMVETLVFAISEIPRDPHVAELITAGEHFSVGTVLDLGFIQEEMLALAEEGLPLSKARRDELAELLLRILHSFLVDPGQKRSEAELRTFLERWLLPTIEAQLNGKR